ncbi:AAA family ATPase [Leeuwenhoekiella aestuarii]|uniref:Homeodomain-like domain-containing protein n=1 Tax=Leeuwenhoekiella aestuarii TaxID=2249426 RepID=A0A4Q0NXJ4_9FLAO|nr:AAA family ATPase [Leeuwenhoekiella aestuarii]RXG16551.1 Homeodomain-like domain-containing protein [Leeuwenhoekiella aestuarii]
MELKKSSNNNALENKKKNILMDKLANEWLRIASRIESPKSLFGNIWHQGEVGILFSNTGKGKSVLAVQLADSISKGTEILGLQSNEQKVIYFDFELSTKSFQQRYSEDNHSPYNFSDNLIRVEIDRNKNLEIENNSFEELIIESIKLQVEKNKAEVIIVDNITFLSASNEKSQEALALMKLILDLSRKDNISILLIAHTPKRDVYRPIQLEDLAGSKALSNFVDVCFCIGESIQGSNIRYIKQLKNRNYPIEYGESNVINCIIDKNDCFLKFIFKDLGMEKDHLQGNNTEDGKFKEARVLKESGKTNVEIAKQFDVSEKTIRRWLKKF